MGDDHHRCWYDEVLKKQYGLRFPVLAVGLGIYLPMDASVPCVIGGLLSWVTQKRVDKLYSPLHLANHDVANIHKRRGLLLACGLVAGASIMGVVLAIPFVLKESSDALRLMPEQWMPFSGILSLVVTFGLCFWIYRSVTLRVSSK
jgi:hypothetical protein